MTLWVVAGPFGASWGPDDTIVFGQPNGIMRVSADGGTPETLIEVGAGERVTGPQILPDGKSMLFTLATAPGNEGWDAGEIIVQSLVEPYEQRTFGLAGRAARYVPTGHITYVVEGVLFAVPFDLVRMEVTGRRVALVEGIQTAGPSGMPQYSFSSDGSLAYILGPVAGASAVLSNLVWVDREGNETPITAEPSDYRFPNLSSNGNQVVYVSGGGDLWIYSIETGVAQQLTFDPADRNPVWHPDGRRLAFGSERGGSGRDIYLKSVDSTEEPEILLSRDGSQVPASWSPDGRVIAFYDISGEAGGRDIYTLSLLDGRVTPFVATGANERGPKFSPDGNWIAYVSDELGEDEIFVTPYPAAPGAKGAYPLKGVPNRDGVPTVGSCSTATVRA